MVSLHGYTEAPEGCRDLRTGEQVSGTVNHGDGLVLLGCGVVLLWCGVVLLGCGVVLLGCGVVLLGCGVVLLGCGVVLLGTTGTGNGKESGKSQGCENLRATDRLQYRL
jgi:hypothetical protein